MNYFGEHFTPMPIRHRIEFPERREKMVPHVAIVGAGNKIADGPAINHVIAQRKIRQRLLRGDAALRRIARGLRECRCDAVNTQAFLHRVINIAFCIDGAGKVIVQIAALG